MKTKISKILVVFLIVVGILGISSYVNAEPQINFLGEIPSSCTTSEDGKFKTVQDMAVDSKGNIFVVDKYNHRIEVFDENGSFIKSLGCPGTAPGRFMYPGAIAIDHNDRMLIADSWDRIQIFDKNGNPVDISGGTGIPWIEGSGEYSFDPLLEHQLKDDAQGPRFVSIAVDANNRIIASHVSPCETNVYDSGGNFIKKLNDECGKVAVNSKDMIIIQTANGIKMYDSSGNFIKTVPNINGFDAIDSNDNFLIRKTNGTQYSYITEKIDVYYENGTYIQTIIGDINTSEIELGVLVCDQNGRIIIASDDANRSIKIFDNNGNFIRKFGGKGEVNENIVFPFGVAANGNKIFIASTQTHKVQIFDQNKTYIKTIQKMLTSTGSPINLKTPYDVAIDSDGRMIVAEEGTSYGRITIISSNGSFITAYGNRDEDDDKLYSPGSVDVDSHDRIIVADTFYSRIKIFDSNLNPIKTFGSNGSSNGQFYAPFGVAVDKDDRVIVADTLNNRVQIFDKNGNFIKKFGGEGTGNGLFNWPWGVAAYNDIIAVSDFNNHRIQFFDRNGTFIKSYGEIGFEHSQFITPTGLDFDDYGRLYVTDTGNYRIQSFELKNYAKDGWNCSANSECENNYCKNNTCTTDIVKTYSVSLNSGWNLVSIPLTPKNTSIKIVLSSVEGKYTKVGAWVNSTGKHYIPGFPFNTLTSIDEKMGFWIKMNQTGTLTVEGYEPDERKINLQVGWNLVGYLSTNKTLPLANALSSINGEYTKVGAWINSTGKHYISGFPFNTLINMSEGYGYWIKMNESGVLEY